MLIDNGFTPEWITLQKEIHQDKITIENDLLKDRMDFGEFPLNENDFTEWCNIVRKYKKAVHTVNKKIEKYNLIVPVMQKQMLLVNLEKVADNVLKKGRANPRGTVLRRKLRESVKVDDNSFNIFSFIDYIFKK